MRNVLEKVKNHQESKTGLIVTSWMEIQSHLPALSHTHTIMWPFRLHWTQEQLQQRDSENHISFLIQNLVHYNNSFTHKFSIYHEGRVELCMCFSKCELTEIN